MCLSLITLHVNCLISPVKRHKLADWMKNIVQVFVADRICTSLAKTNLFLGWKAGKGVLNGELESKQVLLF